MTAADTSSAESRDPGTGAKQRRVVVGVDGSEASLRAVDVAVEESQLRGAVLEIMHAWSIAADRYPAPLSPGVPVPTHLLPGLEKEAEAILAAAVARVPADSGVTVESSLVDADAATTLVEKSAHADLVVVGTRGLSRLAEFIIGSTSKAVIDHAHCPVIVVPPAAKR